MKFARLLLAVAVALATEAGATTFIPMPIEDLTRSSVAVAIGYVQTTRGVAAANGHIYTLIDVAVDEVLHGQVPASAITLKEPGGTAGGMTERYEGVAEYGVGDQVVVFLTVWRDGSLRTNHLTLGRWIIDRDASGQFRASQTIGHGISVIPPPGRALPATVVSLADLRAAVDRGRAVPSTAAPGPAAVAAPPEGVAGGADDGGVAPFVLLSPGVRFHDFDESLIANFLIDNRGDSTLGLPDSRQAVIDAMNAWNGVGTANIIMANPPGNSGLTDDLDTSCSPIDPVDPHRVIFDDPGEVVPDPNNCSGILAVGGGCFSSDGIKVFGAPSTTFNRRSRGYVIFNDGWSTCPEWDPCNVAEVATHELGHVLGFGHTADSDATMRASAHFDGRCADVRTDDENAAAFVYPTAIPPTITTATPIVPPGQTGAFYTNTFTAAGGTPPYTWTEVADCTSQLTLDAGGTYSGTPTFMANCFLDARVTDNVGNNHTKRLYLEVTASGTTTTTSTTTTTVTTSTTTTTTLPIFSIDHFLLYKVKATLGQPKFNALGPVNLADQFRDVDYNVVKPKQLGLPADKNGEGVIDAATHLEEYSLKAPTTTTKFTAVTNVLVSNQCGSFFVEVKKPLSLLVPTNKSLVSSPPPPGVTAVDHYLCYQAKLQRTLPNGQAQAKFPKGIQVDLEDQFQPDPPAPNPRRYDLKSISKVCTPVDKSGSPIYLAGPNEGNPASITPASIQHPIEHLVCYKAKVARKFIAQTSCRPTTPGDLGTTIDPPNPKHVARVGLYLANQLGTERLDTQREAELCMPSLKTLPP